MTNNRENDEELNAFLADLDLQIKALNGLSDVDLGCRVGAIGHRWTQVEPDWKPNVGGVTAMAKQCDICTTVVRWTISNRYGEYLNKPVYDYPDDYLIPRGGPRIKPQATRAVWAKRLRKRKLPPIKAHPTVDGVEWVAPPGGAS